jgi:hypothetical protein
VLINSGAGVMSSEASLSGTRGGLPAGSIIPFAGAVLPAGYLWCDGTAYADATYPLLDAALANAWDTAKKQDGSADYWTSPGAGQFRVPDLRGAFLRGVGTSSRTDGSADVAVALVTYVDDTNKSHDHSVTSNVAITSHAITDPGHGHSLSLYTTGSGAAHGSAEKTATFTSRGGYVLSNTTGITIADHTLTNNAVTSVASGGTETSPRYVGVNYIVKY